LDGATTSGIARAAGCSDGLTFARYPSKLLLFLDASRRQQAISFRKYNADQTQVRTKHGMGIADAVAIREVQRALAVSIARGRGLARRPVPQPGAWSLPYDVVTIPLAERSPAH
jgi:AcrR family transcriptional regulator